MNDVKLVMHDFYNKVYLYIHEHFDPEISEKKLRIDKHARDLFRVNPDPSCKIRDIKVKIIKSYADLSNISDAETRFTTAVAKAKQSFGIKINLEENSKLEFANSLKLIPQKKLDLVQNNEPFSLKRNIYIKEQITTEDPEKSKKLREFLTMPEMKELAEEMDSDMRHGITLQRFAELIGSKYPDKIRDICTLYNQNPSKKIELGADDMTDACFALLLLQKGGHFPVAVEELVTFCGRNSHLNQGSDASLGSIEAAAQPFILAISLIDQDAAFRFNQL